MDSDGKACVSGKSSGHSGDGESNSSQALGSSADGRQYRSNQQDGAAPWRPEWHQTSLEGKKEDDDKRQNQTDRWRKERERRGEEETEGEGNKHKMWIVAQGGF